MKKTTYTIWASFNWPPSLIGSKTDFETRLNQFRREIQYAIESVPNFWLPGLFTLIVG
jgi:hypothetical protein